MENRSDRLTKWVEGSPTMNIAVTILIVLTVLYFLFHILRWAF